MIGITARSLLLAVFWLGASCPLAASQLSAAKRVTAQQFGYDHTWRGPGTQGRPDQLFRRGLGSRSGFSEQAYSGRCYHCLGFCNYPGDPTRGPIRPRRLQRRRHHGHSYAGTGSLIHSVSLRRSSSSASATSIDGSGPARSCDSGCSVASGGRGEAGHPAENPRCAPPDRLHGAVRAAHRGPTTRSGH